MEQLLFYNSKIVTVSLLLCAVLATFGVMMLVRDLLHTSGTTFRRFLELRFRPAALRATSRFEESLAGFQEAADLLGRYSPDYAAVYNEANWSTLCVYLDDLGLAYGDLCKALDEGESKEALCIAEFLSSEGKELTPWKYRHISEEWEHLNNWEHELYDIVCKVIQHLEKAVLDARKLGISRGASADETLAVLERIRSQM